MQIAHFATALIVSILPADAAAAPDTSAMPELQLDALLPALVAGLKRMLPDAYSARDLTVCLPHKVTIKDGKPVGFAILFALNSKSDTGGYTGLRSYGAIFKNGRAKMIFPSSLAGKGGLDHVINRAIMKQIAPCQLIPQARLQKLLENTAAL